MSPSQSWLAAALTRPSTLFLLVAGLTALRLISVLLAETDLFFDEAQYWAWSRDFAFGYFSKPPLIAWIIRGATSLCGDTEACIRSASPLFHAGTALLIYSTARVYFDRGISVLAGIAYVTLPGVSFSAAVISTDVPLLFFWSLALRAWIGVIETRRAAWAIALGVALGLGLLAKYAMIYFVLGAAVHLVVSRDARTRVSPLLAACALTIGAAIVAPNLIWNLRNGLATFRHTADNADWSGFVLNPGPAAEFVLGQLGVFGPIPFVVLLWIGYRALKEPAAEPMRLLLAFSLPIILLITVQALLSRAHANWGATAYPAASVLVVAWMIERGAWRWLAASFGLHAFAALVLLLAHPLAPVLALGGSANPFGRVLGWEKTAEEVKEAVAAGDYGQVLTESRQMAAELTYYLRDLEIPVTAWLRDGRPPRHHYEVASPFQPSRLPALLATSKQEHPGVTSAFESVERLPDIVVSPGVSEPRHIHLFRLDGLRSTPGEGL